MQLKINRSAYLLVPIFLAGCCTSPLKPDGVPASVADVVSSIKADIQTYNSYAGEHINDVAMPNQCRGKINFKLDKVEVSLTTTNDSALDKNAGPVIPVGAGTISPAWERSTEAVGTQTLTFAIYPSEPKSSVTTLSNSNIDPQKYPIAAYLKNLREGLLKASDVSPCVSLASDTPDKDDPNKFEFGFTVTNKSTNGLDIKFAVFSLGATKTTTQTAGNTITVSFSPTAGSVAALKLQ